MTKAYFGAGCFWGVEETFRQLRGVKSTSVGYGGGHQDSPNYQQVCSGGTGHAELVEVEYNPVELPYDKLLGVFWKCHNPLQHNRQGADVGTQYRSVIFYTDGSQAQVAKKSKEELQKGFKSLGQSIATKVEAFKNYYLAEDYHQQYVAKRNSKRR